jgi:3-oxoacyl-[acyl-carrier protein] reductase
MSRHVLVTGVSRGLGLAVARALVETEWHVWGVSRGGSNELAALVRASAGRLRYGAVDLTRDGAVERIFADFLPRDLELHAVVNNAGVAYDDLVSNLDIDRLRAMFDLNVTVPMAVTRHAIRRMLVHGTSGAFVHVSSVAAHTGYKGLAMYGASKGALEAFSRGVAREWGGRGIRSNCVAPGFLETDMSAGLSEAQRAAVFRRNALGAPASLASVAATVVHLLAEGSASVTGQTLVVDAGSL